MSNKKKTFSQFLRDLGAIARSTDLYNDKVLASQCFRAFYPKHTRLAAQHGYVRDMGGIWVVTSKGNAFMRQLEGDFS